MSGFIHRIRDKIAKQSGKLLTPKAREGRLSGPDFESLLIETQQHYPGLPVWETISHPRDNHFNIYILPLRQPLPEVLQPVMQELKKQMEQDGISPDQRQISSQYEQRFSHLWLAEIQRWHYDPIGISTFTIEPKVRKDVDEACWLSVVWLNPAQRNHNVLRNTVPYFKKWHPNFKIARDHGIINRSLKDYPEHLPDASGSSPMWA